MSPPIRLDDLEREQGTATPPRKRRPGEPINLDELEGAPASPAPVAPAPAAPPPAGSTIDLSQPQTPNELAAAGKTPAPAPRRGIGAMVSDLVDRGAQALDRFGRTSQAAARGQQPTAEAVTSIPDEQRRLAVIGDRRTPEERLAGTRRHYDATIAQRPDATRVTPAGSAQASAEATATQAMGDEHARQQRNFTPEQLRDLAKRGMARAAELNAQAVELQKTDPAAAEALHQHAEDFSRKAYNSQVLADDVGQADTFDAVVLSNMLGVFHDPYAGQQRNIAEAAQGGSTFTPEEQQRDLGKNAVVPASRDFSLTDSRDVLAPLVGGAIPFVVGDAAVAAGAKGVAILAGERAPLARRIGEAIADLYGETRAVGPRQAGLGGAKEAMQQIVADAPKVIRRGMTMGQVPGAIMAAREAQQRGENPSQAAIGSVLGNLLMGPIAELGFHAGGEFGRLAARTDLNIGRKWFPEYGMARERPAGKTYAPETFERLGGARPVAEDAPTVARAVEGARAVQGQTALADKTDSGQHATIAKLLDSVLGEKGSEEAVANEALRREATRPLVEPATDVLRPRRSDENVPLRSATEVAMERAGPADEANAVVRMERARREAAMQQEEVARQMDQARIERAAAERTVQQHGPKTLRETLETAGREHAEGDPLATEYHDAINKFAEAAAAMQDAGETPSERTRLTYARARNALNDARKRYGVQAGAAAIAALASADSDLTDEEKRTMGLGALAIGATKVIPRGLPPSLRAAGRELFEKALRSDAPARTVDRWLAWMHEQGLKTGEHHDEVASKLWTMAGHNHETELPSADVARLFVEPGDEQGLPRGFRSRLRDTVETLGKQRDPSGAFIGGKAWDSPRPVGDWIGKLKGTSTFSKAELTTILPTLDEWAAAKRKITRADVLGLLDEKLPQIERLTFMNIPHEEHVPAPEPEVVDIRPVEDLTAAHQGEITEQINVRRDRIEEIEANVADQITDARRREESAETDLQEAQNEVRNTLARFEDADHARVMRAIEDVLNEDVASDHVPRDTVDNAYEAAMEQGGFSYDEQIIDPSDVGFDIEEIPNPHDAEGEPWVRATSPEGNSYDAPSKWEAMAKAEREGEYNTGGRNSIFPDDAYIKEETEGPLWKIYSRDTGRLVSTERMPSWYTEGEAQWTRDLREQGWDEANYRIDHEPADPTQTKFVLRRREGRKIFEGDIGQSRESFLDRWVDFHFEPKVSESDLTELRDDIERWARRKAEYMDAESTHYGMNEGGYYFEDEKAEVDRLREEMQALGEQHALAQPEPQPEPEVPAPAEAFDPNAALPIESIGGVSYSTYQRIPGGRDYRELVNSWINRPGGDIPNKAYGVTSNHDYWTEKGAPNAVGHLRAEVHDLYPTPGLEGERVQIDPNLPTEIKERYDNIAENRAKRRKLFDEMQGIADAYDRLPAIETNPAAPSEGAMELAKQYDALNNQVRDIGKREEHLASVIREERARLLGEEPPTPLNVFNVLESQTSLSQYQVSLADIAYEELPVLHEKYDAANREVAILTDERSEKNEALYQARRRVQKVIDKMTNEVGENLKLRDALEAQGHAELARQVRYGADSDFIDTPEFAPVWQWFEEHYPEITPKIAEAREAKIALTETQTKLRVAGELTKKLNDQIAGVAGKTDVGMFADINNAQAFNAARAWIDWANGDHDALMFSDGANRRRNAHLQLKAARKWYDELWPSAHKRILGFMGQNIPIEHTYVHGEGHWIIKPPDPKALRTFIRKYGVWPLSVVAMSAVPQDAEAQDGKSRASLYGSVVGGMAVGGLLAAMASNRKLRALVKENRELNRAVMMDDLSGLSNKRAHRLAIESIDRDPKTAWIAFDGDRFKQLNDLHGHPEGDKAIQHFGETIRTVAEQLGIPQRGFRSGGDEFAMAVPKERAADALRAVEEASRFTKDGVTTKLTGSIGDVWAEADDALTATKDKNRRADPSLNRVVRPEMEAKLTSEISKALDNAAATDPAARDAVTRVRSGKIDARVLIALSGIPFMVTAGAIAGNTAEEKKTNMLIGAVLPLVLAGGAPLVEKAVGAARRALRDESISPEQRAAVQEVVDRLGTAEQRKASEKGGFRLYANPIGPALSELKKYPSAAALGLVGYAMTDSDNENVRRAGVPTMALAALSAIGSERILAGKDALGSRLVNLLRKSAEGTNAVRLFNPDALLSPEVRAAIVQYERDTAKGRARAAELAAKAKKLGGEGDRTVSDVLDAEEWEDQAHMTAQQTTDILSVAAELADEYDTLTREQVNRGTLAQTSVIPNYGGPRKYAYFDALAALADSPTNLGKPGRRPKITAVKQRTLDVPLREAEEAVRMAQASGDQTQIDEALSRLDEAKVVQLSKRVELGEIREASYRAAVGIERNHNNIASAKLFDTIRNIPGSAHPDWVQAVDDLLSAKAMRASAATPADRDAAQLLLNDATVALDEVTKKFQARGGEYVALPDSPSLGVLRGAVVKRDIAHSLEGFGTPGLYGKMLRGWKELKTVFNPGTSVGNILSNVTALHMGDVPVWLQPYYLTQAARDLKGYGEGTRALAEAGVLNVNSVTALGTGEVGRRMRTEQGLEELLPTTRVETQKVLREQGITEERTRAKLNLRRAKGMAVGAVIGGAKGYDPEDSSGLATGMALGAGAGALFGGRGANFIRRAYDNEDNLARIAVFLRRRNLGDTIEQARDRAIGSLGNFRSRSPALKLLSSTVSPFIMYQAKAVPAFAKNVVDHPWKYLTLMAAWGAVNELGKQDMGEVPETDIPVPDRRTYGYFFPGFTQLPFGDEQGNKAAVDMARWTPMAGVTTGAPPGSVPEAFSDQGQQIVTPGGPVIDAALQVSNVDPYSKGPLLHRDYPTSENAATLAHKAADFVLPSALGLHATRLKTDLDNGDFTKFKNDLLGPTGAKPRYVRPGAVLQDASFTLERDLRDMQAALVRDLRANKDEERKAMLVDRYRRRVGTALINFKSRVGAPPDPAIVEQYFTSPDAGATSEP